MKILVFRLSEGWYGVSVPRVHAVLKPVAVTRVPGAGPAVLGVFNLRSMVLPLVDLERVLDGARTPRPFGGKRERFVVCERGDRLQAFQVAEVRGIVELPDEDLDRHALRGSERARCFDGVCRIDEIDCVVLRVDDLLDDAMDAVAADGAS